VPLQEYVSRKKILSEYTSFSSSIDTLVTGAGRDSTAVVPRVLPIPAVTVLS
jgi:hypothetical protein